MIRRLEATQHLRKVRLGTKSQWSYLIVQSLWWRRQSGLVDFTILGSQSSFGGLSFLSHGEFICFS
jgi:hypothetical protein